MTNKMEREAYAYFDRIREFGGVIPAIDAGFFQREIADAAFDYQEQVDAGDRIVVGVNAYVDENEAPPEILKVDSALEIKQRARLAAVRARRDGAEVERTLAALGQAAREGRNLMPSLVDCARVYASVGEMCDVLRGEFGLYRETPFF
jgi:methylmalonyl-CoA mutase N-terminal domain/subunit